MEQKNRHGLCIFVENEFGVIQRVTNLFSARGMNIETIHTAPIDDCGIISQISISLFESEKNIELIKNLLERVIVVHAVVHFIILEDEGYNSCVINCTQTNEIQEILIKYNIKVFNMPLTSKSFCLVGRSVEIHQFLLDTQRSLNIITSKNYKIF